MTYDDKLYIMTTTKYTTSDFLTPEELNRLIRYFKRLENHQMELLIEFSTKTLLRYSDLSRIKWEDVIGRETLVLNEKKTNKRREITLGRSIRERIEMVHNQLGNPNNEEYIFNYSLQYVNRLLKEGGKDVKIRNKNISSHSFRKSGSRYIWESNGNSDEYLIKLSSILNHSSTSITRRYLGISKEEIKDIYHSFDELL